MVITSIVVGIASSMYLNMHQYFNMSEYENNKNLDIAFVTSLLKNDMEKAISVHSNYSIVSFVGQNHKVKEYDFNDDFIVRKVNFNRDTFFVKTEDLEIIKLNSNSSLISEINVMFSVDSVAFPLHLYKAYTRDILFNLYQKKE